ncbi:MAG: two-component sensor histidine kinase [Burkholderiaceae bacterium]|nr:two-component sensor histidine kinase [Burkholderiaceae bacterium]
MHAPVRRSSFFAHQWPRVLLGLVVAALGCVWLARAALDRQHEAFDTDGRIVHRLISQQVVQHDAVLVTLALLQPGPGAAPGRLTSLYPQILSVISRGPGAIWPDAALAAAEARSRTSRRAELADADFAAERFRIVLASQPASHAFVIHARQMVPWHEWPMLRDASPVRVELQQAGQRLVLQAGDGGMAAGAGGWHFEFRKRLASDSQPFDVVLEQRVGWGGLPWLAMLAWCMVVALALAAQAAVQRQRAARRRAEDLLRLGHVARLNTLGELAAGMAHELNQPLTAVLASTQAARRLLQEDPPELATAREAMTRAAEQARRASDVVGRLRRSIERPELAPRMDTVDLSAIARAALDLLEPEFARRNAAARLVAPVPVRVQADAVAVEQILHNLLMNALQALEMVPVGRRSVEVRVHADGAAAASGTIEVRDSGPGIAADVLPRIFEPFFSTRAGGHGLGLSLCESLATGMGGTLVATSDGEHGSTFTLSLPLAAGG